MYSCLRSQLEFLPQKLDQFIINKKKDFWTQEDQLIMKKGFLGTRAGPINQKKEGFLGTRAGPINHEKKDFWVQEQDQLIMKKRIIGHKSRTSLSSVKKDC